MIKVSVFYPNGPDAYFDIEYYCSKHMPLVQRLVGPSLKSVQVDHGMNSSQAGSPPRYLAMGHLIFESVQAFETSFGPHTAEIIADVKNYTNVDPLIQVSEIRIL